MVANGQAVRDRVGNATVELDIFAVLEAVAGSHPDLELLVLFGSVARGDARPDSDVDLIVDGPITRDRVAWTQLRGRLLEALGRPVELLSLREAEQVPAVLLGALRDGRVVRDSKGRWGRVLADRSGIEDRAQREYGTYAGRRAAVLSVL